jgi:hypothetical protein
MPGVAWPFPMRCWCWCRAIHSASMRWPACWSGAACVWRGAASPCRTVKPRSGWVTAWAKWPLISALPILLLLAAACCRWAGKT